jgi:hypothetical protein
MAFGPFRAQKVLRPAPLEVSFYHQKASTWLTQGSNWRRGQQQNFLRWRFVFTDTGFPPSE